MPMHGLHRRIGRLTRMERGQRGFFEGTQRFETDRRKAEYFYAVPPWVSATTTVLDFHQGISFPALR